MPDIHMTPRGVLCRDPRLSKRFGPNFDKDTDFVYVNPRVMAWELMDANHSLPPGHLDRDPNPWLISKGDSREHDPLYQKEYMLIDRASLVKVRHLDLTVIPDDVALPAIALRKQIDDDEYYEEMNIWFANERRKEERRLLRKSGLNIDEPLMIKNYDDEDEEEDSGSSTEQLLNDLRIAMNRTTRPIFKCEETEDETNDAEDAGTTKLARIPAFQYQIPAVENAKFFDDSYTLMGKVVRRQLELARSLDWTEESLGSDAPKFQREAIAFHKERLRILKCREVMSRSTTQSLTVSGNFKHVLFDSTSANLFVPITNPDPEIRSYLKKGQTELLLLLDLMRAQWTRLEYLDHYFDPEYRSLFKEHGHDTNNKRIAEIVEKKTIRTFSNLTHHQRNVLELTVELMCEDLDGQLEEDMGYLLQFAIFRYITATPDQDLEMRQALLVMWEMKIVGTDLRSLPRSQLKPCSCWARYRLRRTMKQYRVEDKYWGFFSKHCMKDRSILENLLDEDYIPDIPHPLEDIAMEVVRYGDQTWYIPSWMAVKHRFIPDLCREARHCFLRNKGCHGSLADHADLIMALIWGHHYFLCDGADHETFKSFRDEIGAFIAKRDESTLKAKCEALGEMMLEYDQKMMNDRRKYRMRIPHDGKKSDESSWQSDAGSARAKYIALMASELLGVSAGQQEPTDGDIGTEMMKKGWIVKRPGRRNKNRSMIQQQETHIRKVSKQTVRGQFPQFAPKPIKSTRDILRELKKRSLERRKENKEKKAKKKNEKGQDGESNYVGGAAAKAVLRFFGGDKAVARGVRPKSED
ncbi:hypothetical protein TWF696_004739 [Orbilia brochopaga]|uniref:Uncharacterized protein n=1 Tax=Orbilia brochopaga TaxID=3140254 RepID=A0AAV9UYL9_9PEZI